MLIVFGVIEESERRCAIIMNQLSNFVKLNIYVTIHRTKSKSRFYPFTGLPIHFLNLSNVIEELIIRINCV